MIPSGTQQHQTPPSAPVRHASPASPPPTEQTACTMAPVRVMSPSCLGLARKLRPTYLYNAGSVCSLQRSRMPARHTKRVVLQAGGA